MTLKIRHITTNLLIIALWLWLYASIFDYLSVIFSREDFRTNQIILLGVIILIAVQVRQGGIRPRVDALPHLYSPALLLALGGSLLYLLVERYFDVNTISASLFGLASYGLLGLWMAPRRWRQGLPALLLLIGTLPFGEHTQTFIGYPMRILTAAMVRDGLAALGVASMGIDTILVLENGVSQIDLPCSGVKSLWTGMLFLIAATWIERRPFNGYWFLLALLFSLLLFLANLTRVSILVLVGQVGGWIIAAEMLHVPLGVLGFVLACAAAVALLRLQKPLRQDAWQLKISPVLPSPPQPPFSLPPQPWGGGRKGEVPRLHPIPLPKMCFERPPFIPPNVGADKGEKGRSEGQPRWLVPTLLVSITLMALLYSQRPAIGLAQAPPTWHFPQELTTEPMPLKPDEFEWLTHDGAESADRRRFEWRGITGSMILITSSSWRAHHRPERCFEVYGLTLHNSRTHFVKQDFPLRVVSLGGGIHPLSATYWFQSAQHTTDDYATRMWADLTPERERWVLVSILFDDAYQPHNAELQALYTGLHQAVQEELAEEK